MKTNQNVNRFAMETLSSADRYANTLSHIVTLTRTRYTLNLPGYKHHSSLKLHYLLKRR
jgi:hypothetical protein